MKKGLEQDCEQRTTIGLTGFGGFSEYVHIPRDQRLSRAK